MRRSRGGPCCAPCQLHADQGRRCVRPDRLRLGRPLRGSATLTVSPDRMAIGYRLSAIGNRQRRAVAGVDLLRRAATREARNRLCSAPRQGQRIRRGQGVQGLVAGTGARRGTHVGQTPFAQADHDPLTPRRAPRGGLAREHRCDGPQRIRSHGLNDSTRSLRASKPTVTRPSDHTTTGRLITLG